MFLFLSMPQVIEQSLFLFLFSLALLYVLKTALNPEAEVGKVGDRSLAILWGTLSSLNSFFNLLYVQ